MLNGDTSDSLLLSNNLPQSELWQNPTAEVPLLKPAKVTMNVVVTICNKEYTPWDRNVNILMEAIVANWKNIHYHKGSTEWSLKSQLDVQASIKRFQ
jgi:hypothetical protein